MHRILALALLASAVSSAIAAQAESSRPDPTNPAIAVPRQKYESAFGGYEPFREEKLENWRALNDEVGRAGGHIGIFGGGSGHAGHGAAKPAQGKPMPTKPGAPAAAGGQPPMRSAPKTPAAEHQQH
jgi:hypothetical protein